MLFDDGYTKRCHAKDMSKIKRQPPGINVSSTPATPPFNTSGTGCVAPPQMMSPNQTAAAVQQQQQLRQSFAQSPAASAAATPAAVTTASKASTSGGSGGGRKINPPLPIPKFDLSTLNLLPVPKDGEWCCNWVNDTPIGAEGYLEGPDGNRRPTVLVDDWRLPAGWTKHLYQRSSVSGKWDVVLVGPTKKRFRSKNDVKVFLDEYGLQYNPDVYDFSIHKRRAKDLGLFIFTDDYKDELKAKQLAKTAAEHPHLLQQHQQLQLGSNDMLNISNISNEELFQGFGKPAASSSPPPLPSSALGSTPEFQGFVTPAAAAAPAANVQSPRPSSVSTLQSPTGDFVYIGSLKIRVHNNLFCCPEPGCNKTFRRDSHLQIHIKHYHEGLAKQAGECLNMAELAYFRTTGELPLPEDGGSAATATKTSVDATTQDAGLLPTDVVGDMQVPALLEAPEAADFQQLLDATHSSTPLRTMHAIDAAPT